MKLSEIVQDLSLEESFKSPDGYWSDLPSDLEKIPNWKLKKIKGSLEGEVGEGKFDIVMTRRMFGNVITVKFFTDMPRFSPAGSSSDFSIEIKIGKEIVYQDKGSGSISLNEIKDFLGRFDDAYTLKFDLDKLKINNLVFK